MTPSRSQDIAFEKSLTAHIHDPRQLRHLSQPIILEEVGPPRTLRALVMLLTVFVFGFLIWAAVTRLTETTRAQGEVVPTGSVLSVQHLEGGIISKILVRDGTLVERGQVLVRLDPTASLAQLDEMQTRQTASEIRLLRLRAFAEGRVPDFSAIPSKFADLVRSERAAFDQQTSSLNKERRVLEFQVDQRRSEIALLVTQATQLTAKLKILEEQKTMQEALLPQGLVSRMVYLRTLEQYQGAAGDLAEIGSKMKRARSAAAEASGKLAQLIATRRNEATDEAGKLAAEIATIRETAIRLKDRVQRLDVVAPVRGIVKGLETKTIGGVLQPGGVVTEIVPVDEELIVEARVSPIDVGHIKVGQTTNVKITTFDFARFGSIEGRVSKISASTFKDRKDEVYYKAEIRLSKNYVGSNAAHNIVLPGMVAEVDINTGNRTLLEYLLRPIYQSLDSAFTER